MLTRSAETLLLITTVVRYNNLPAVIEYSAQNVLLFTIVIGHNCCWLQQWAREEIELPAESLLLPLRVACHKFPAPGRLQSKVDLPGYL